MNNQSILDQMKRDKSLLYADIRDQIQSGDLLALHHDFVASWYGIQIEAVQRFTGPFAHIALLERVSFGGRDRVIVAESVVPRVRGVPVSVTAEQGFFWLPMKRTPSAAEQDSVIESFGTGEYSKVGAIEAGGGFLSKDEDADPRMWCAKRVKLWVEKSGIDLGQSCVPTEMVFAAMLKYNAPLHYVRMSNE